MSPPQGPRRERLPEGSSFSLARSRGRSSNFSLRCIRDKKVPIRVTLLVVGLLLTLIAQLAKKCPSCPTPALPGCLESGIGLEGKFFYFMEQEWDGAGMGWNRNEASCLSHPAHLTTINTWEELGRGIPSNFLLCYRWSVHHWIGLQREGSRPWEWFNGSLFNALFGIHGNGQCAYTNSHGISSNWCSQRKFSICSHSQRSPSGVWKDPGTQNST
ncbi:C-type lectin domain family 2 member B-like [Pithys albifrons albifrons]|uniref:C-type lectin domain family 2 member B-like n=1 Tax=Pithys albifrons albifrons TaxID=3385563 RepID=UPI003A5CD444